MMSFYDTLKSLVDKVFLPCRARKGARRVEDPCRMPCRVRKGLERPAGARIRKKEKTSPLPLKKIKISGGGGYLCSRSKTRDLPAILFVHHQPFNFLSFFFIAFDILSKLKTFTEILCLLF